MKILKSLMTIVAVAAIAVSATGAYFTDSEKIVDNTFTTGYLDISVAPTSAAVNVAKAAPGVWYPSAEITVRNNSSKNITEPFKWKISEQWTDGPGINMYREIDAQVWIKGIGYTPSNSTPPDGVPTGATRVYNGPLKGMELTNLRDLPYASTPTVWVYTRIDEAVGNEFMGKTYVFDLIFDATQTNNPGWTE